MTGPPRPVYGPPTPGDQTPPLPTPPGPVGVQPPAQPGPPATKGGKPAPTAQEKARERYAKQTEKMRAEAEQKKYQKLYGLRQQVIQQVLIRNMRKSGNVQKGLINAAESISRQVDLPIDVVLEYLKPQVEGASQFYQERIASSQIPPLPARRTTAPDMFNPGDMPQDPRLAQQAQDYLNRPGNAAMRGPPAPPYGPPTLGNPLMQRQYTPPY